MSASEPTAKKMRIQSNEAVRYDRQMRLWGVDAQLNMMQSKVVVVGLGCLGAEVAKNLALGGVGTLTLVDPAPETSGDAAQNFLLSTDRAAAGEQEAKPVLSRAEASIPALRAMNGLVQLGACGSLAEALEGATCVVVTDVAKPEGLRMLRACRDAAVPAVLCLSFGMLSMGVFDFGASFGNAVKDSTTGELTTHEFAFPDAAKVFGGSGGDGGSGSGSWKNARKLLRSCVACVALWEAGCSVSDSVEAAAERIRVAAAAESAARGVDVCVVCPSLLLHTLPAGSSCRVR